MGSNRKNTRLQKFLAQAGIASRRASEAIIAAGRVTVNGELITEQGVKIDPLKDEVRVDGKKVRLPQNYTYIMLNKPKYVLSTTDDNWGERKTVLDLVDVKARVFPVGRLDFESEGLILLTDDGDLAQKLTHPKFQHEKEYEVLVNGEPDRAAMRKWRAGGFTVDGKIVGPMRVEPLRSNAPGWLRVVLTEGRKHQIRVIAEELGHPVITLVRVRIGSLKLGKLKPGTSRALSPREVDMLKRDVSVKPSPKKRN